MLSLYVNIFSTFVNVWLVYSVLVYVYVCSDCLAASSMACWSGCFIGSQAEGAVDESIGGTLQ